MDKWKSKHRLSWVGQSTNSVYIYPERQKRNTLVPFFVLTNIIALVAHQVLVFLCLYFRLCSENLVRKFWATFEFNFWPVLDFKFEHRLEYMEHNKKLLNDWLEQLNTFNILNTSLDHWLDTNSNSCWRLDDFPRQHLLLATLATLAILHKCTNARIPPHLPARYKLLHIIRQLTMFSGIWCHLVGKAHSAKPSFI